MMLLSIFMKELAESGDKLADRVLRSYRDHYAGTILDENAAAPPRPPGISNGTKRS